MERKYKIYITVRKDKESQSKGWFIVDKKSPIDSKFDTKRLALEYVKENYEDVMVLVQNSDAKFQYTIILEDKKVKSFISKSRNIDAEETTKDVKDVFEYEETTTTTTTVETETPLEPKKEKLIEKQPKSKDSKAFPIWSALIVFLLTSSIALALAAIIVAT